MEIKRPRGRPATGIKRTVQIKFRLTPEEKQQLDEFLNKKNITITQFIVDSIKK